MDNTTFLASISESFKKFLETGSRSNEKLKILHGDIAKDIQLKLGPNYTVSSLGIGSGKEGKIQGRYIFKNVDITILKNNIPIAGLGVKFVMQNYSQNSNNYFENMLGETANIRSCKIPYFQIFIIPDKMPYYSDKGVLKHWETFSVRNASKYIILSKDNSDNFFHTPNKTLLFLIKLPVINIEINSKDEYYNYYRSLPNIIITESDSGYDPFESSVIFNNYELFIEKIIYYMKSL